MSYSGVAKYPDLNWQEVKAIYDYGLKYGRCPLLEDMLLRECSGYHAIQYAIKVLKTRWLELEKKLLNDTYSYGVVDYARDVIHGRWSEAESIIMNNPECIVSYSIDCLKTRWFEAENKLLGHGFDCFLYVRDILKTRWPEAEDCICKNHITGISGYSGYSLDKNPSKHFKEYVSLFPSEELDIYMNVLSVDINNIDRINCQDSGIQTEILRAYPWLINRIQNLDPSVKEKYSKIYRISNLGVI